MDFVSPSGPVYQAGTLSGNPIAMSAGLAMLSYLNEHPEVYKQLAATGRRMVQDIRDNMQALGLNYSINHLGSMFSLFFTQEKVTNFESAKLSDTALFGRYFRSMLEHGVYLPPSQFETLFLSTALSEEDLQQHKKANFESLKAIQEGQRR
jgi:glutamate-1-semialdehyde 2,1-aminomutase